MSGTDETRVSRVSNGLYKDILSGIMMGEYPPHSTLPTEMSLARDYGVSRSVVRLALERLKTQGIVRSQQGSGTIVETFDPSRMAQLNRDSQMSELNDCLTFRLAVEPEIAATVAARPTGAATCYLRGQLEQLDRGLVTGCQPDNARSTEDVSFHIRLAELSGNMHFSSVMQSLRPDILFAMNIAKLLPGKARQDHLDQSMKEHRDIITGILEQDARTARRTMRTHIANARERLFAQTSELIGERA